jgi:outer membrane receptor protein involved in Fe transport
MKARIGLGVGLMALAGAAASQTATTVPRQAPVPASKLPAAPAEQAVPSVNVAAERPSSRIDRQVYDVKNDASASNGTAADALNSVPSVSVAPDGAVQLRGSSNVQILIDGKPSAMLQGEGRGAGLLSIPAEDLDSVEVINNPGAQFGTDGGGGPVINLVMKRIRRPGGSGALSANAGMAGRANAALSGSYNDGAWGYQGSVNVRRDGRDSTVGAVRRRIDPHTGLASLRTQEGSSTGLNDSAGLNATLSYNLGQNDTLGASVNLQRRSNDALGQDHYRNYDAAGMLATDYLSTSQRSGSNRSAALGARWDHKGEAPGELLKFDLRLSRAENPSDSAFRNIPAGAGSAPRGNLRSNDNSNRIGDFTGDYERPGDGGTLKLGYKVSRSSSDIATLYVDVDPSTQSHLVNAARSNSFALVESVYALYGTWQTRVDERWGVLGGLRAEYTDVDISQLTSRVEAANSYLNFIPSMFATYKAGEDANIRISYAHRIRRPMASDLNPFVIYRDEYNVSSGNPQLQPTQTDSAEASYETRLAGMDVNLRGFYSRDQDAILERKVFISDTVLLTTRDNMGSSDGGGLELSVNGKLAAGLTVNASATLARRENAFNDLDGSMVRRSATAAGGKLRVAYQMTEADHVQLMVQAQGRTLSGLGYRKAYSNANLTLRHNFSPMLSMVLNVSDLFERNRFDTVTQTGMLDDRVERRFDGRVVYLGLTYRFSTHIPRVPARS